jgi:hypothetical protein
MRPAAHSCSPSRRAATYTCCSARAAALDTSLLQHRPGSSTRARRTCPLRPRCRCTCRRRTRTTGRAYCRAHAVPVVSRDKGRVAREVRASPDRRRRRSRSMWRRSSHRRRAHSTGWWPTAKRRCEFRGCDVQALARERVAITTKCKRFERDQRKEPMQGRGSPVMRANSPRPERSHRYAQGLFVVVVVDGDGISNAYGSTFESHRHRGGASRVIAVVTAAHAYLARNCAVLRVALRTDS